MMRALAITAALTAAVAATGCTKRLEAPRETGVCFALAQQPDKSIKFNKVAANIKSLEFCAVELERMRLKFLRMGGTVQEVSGTYQGRFIFLGRDGIYTAETYEGPRYLALVRYNGKLVMPGAVPQD